MSTTSYGVNDALAVKLWSKKLAVEVSKATAIAPLIGTSSNSIIQLKDETQKGAGDKVTFGLRTQLIGEGVSEGETLEGNEEALSTFSDAIFINELAHAVRVKNEQTIDAQRVPFSLRKEANEGLTDWYADRLSMAFFLQVCGYTAPTVSFEGQTVTLSSKHYLFNSVLAPSTNRIVRAAAAATDEALVSANVFTLDLIDKAVERAKLANPKIRPVMVNGEKKYVLYLHPTQVTSLRTNTSTGQWLDITKAIYQGSRKDNPIYDGSLGEYNNVILREAEHVMPGVNSTTGAQITTVRRAVLLGAQSAVAAFGMKTAPDKYKTVEELFDYQRELGVSVQSVLGLKKTRFTNNNEDFGCIVISTYAAAS
ncbi:N4-gp56 family major capsid protein [Sinorhizobium meliloti]|uniref:N4-gp56 family major capsid protein n=1 Tax=Rhizobium meliloti TaxID=382 RepID=UPI000B5AACED|nr:N4-gp56 family major capsid protein [Sinorhizobium meliloti]ASJ58987.1 N4-gp56 family major capsid protein [Sinorhizobium meliloti]MCK3783485.1 N4-gp56 family major capsid protein [Sinorhizobium meliloti]MCK3787885.1 N4-gp56 family major capsid protein [Sinorhizobium meliloti]MCK3794838.1 N4-gp56 family major capsid protein [Sinorhizobium meliloti]